MVRITETVKHLIIINVILWLATQALYTKYNFDLGNFLALHFPENDAFGFWQPITSMFMHSIISPMHIIGNMIGLWMFGSALEMRWGSTKFLAFYFITGVGAGLIHTLVNYIEFFSISEAITDLNLTKDQLSQIINFDIVRDKQYLGSILEKDMLPILSEAQKSALTQENFRALFDLNILNSTAAVGASGALYGVLVAFGMLYPNMELMLLFLPIPIKAKYFIPLLLIFDLVSGLSGSTGLLGGGNVAHFAHLGGALFGFLLMWYWNKTQFNKNRWD